MATQVTALIDPVALLLLVAANATPVIMARLLGPRLATPVDAMFRGAAKRPVFGTHKTWRGLVSGVLACGLVGAWLAGGVWVGLGFGLLALAGDLASSFVKRRLRLQSGYSAPLLDQLPESLLPLLVFGNALSLSDAQVFGTALAFTLLDLLATRWRDRAGRVTAHEKRANVYILLPLIVSASMTVALAACAARPSPRAELSGDRLYAASCAACHGPSARGDGPVAPILNVPVPDLTRIASRRGGKFPTDDVYRIIDGQANLAAHGPRHMPVWGIEFFGEDADDESAHAAATEKVDRLVGYLRSIQRHD